MAVDDAQQSEPAPGRRVLRPPETLADGAVVLRPWCGADVDQISSACQDAAIQCYIPIPRPYHRADAEAYIERTARQWDEGFKAAFAIVDSGDHARLWGGVTLAIAGSVGHAAYWVVPEVRGRGVARRALSLVTEWAFGSLDLGVLLLEIDPTNTASIKVAQSAGFHQVGKVEVNAITGERNHLLFSRLAVPPLEIA